MPASPPTKLGPYVVLDQIGSGGMGAVYRALDPRLQRQVAIKVLHRNLEVVGASERFLREARTISSLNHPNICTVFDIGEQDGDPYLVMELLEGEALKDRMLRGPIPEGDLREIAFRVALALQAAHSKGVVHRDVKPANIFLVADGAGTVDVKVLDFGLAKLERDGETARSSRRSLTRNGATVGTVEYMSPEQACGEELDARTDLFSLGAVLYEMATGRLPFPGATSAIVFAALLNQEPVALRDGKLNLSAELESIIRRLLVKNRADRMPSASALLEALLAEEKSESGGESVAGETRRRLLSGVVSAVPPLREGERAGDGKGPESLQVPTRQRSRAPRPFPSAISAEEAPGSDAPASLVTAGPSGQSVASVSASAARGSGEANLDVREHRTSPSNPTLEPADPMAGNRKRRTGEALRQGNRPYSIGTAAEFSGPKVTQPDSSSSRGPLFALLFLLVVGGAAAVWLGFRSRNGDSHGPTIRGAVQILPINSPAGDRVLGSASTELLRLLLTESPLLTVREPAASDVLGGGNDATAARVQKFVKAQRSNPATVDELFTATGNLSPAPNGLLVRLSVRRATGNAPVAEVEAPAASAAEVPAVLASLVGHLRVRLGEDAASVKENSADSLDNGRSQDSDSFLAALSANAKGEALVEKGDDAGALEAFTAAVHKAPAFLPSRLHIADLLLCLHADREASEALDAIASAAVTGGPHLRAEREYLLARRENNEDALHVAERWRTSRPADAEAQAASAEQLLHTGHAKDAVAAAAAAVQLNPYQRHNQELQIRAQIENGQPDAAWTTQTQAFDAGLGSPGLALAAAVLKNNRGQTALALSRLRSDKPNFSLLLDDATYRANTGDLQGAAATFQRAGTAASQIAGASSAANYAAALDRWNMALAGQCASFAAAGSDTGEAAVLAWMTAAWCHLPAPQHATAPGDSRADASRLWLAGDKAGALAALSNAHAPDALLLRARLEMLLGRADAATVDGRAVVERRGTAYLSGQISYPAALALLTATYRSRGDVANAETEQAALREVWQNPAALAHLLQASETPR